MILYAARDRLTLWEKLRSIRWSFILLLTFVASVGVVSLYSAAGGSMDPWAGQHMARYGVSLVILLVVAMIDIRVWMQLAYILYFLVALLLVWVDVKGHIGMGAQRWIDLGFMQLQPSELMKVALVLALARFFHGASPEDVRNPLFLIRPLLLVALPVLLVVAQPDLGTAMKLILAAGAMFFLAGVSYWMFGLVLGAVAGAMPVLWSLMHDYQRKRVLTFLDPESDPLGAGYHITQSKIAIGSGGVTGKGFLQGTQSALDFLPEKQTDFIFTLYTEEWGLMGGLFLMFLFMLVIGYGYVMAFGSQSQFGRLLSLGLVFNFSMYAIINMGMVMGLLPVVGIPLPLVSYGGTAMLALMGGFGLLMSAYVHRDVRFLK